MTRSAGTTAAPAGKKAKKKSTRQCTQKGCVVFDHHLCHDGKRPPAGTPLLIPHPGTTASTYGGPGTRVQPLVPVLLRPDASLPRSTASSSPEPTSAIPPLTSAELGEAIIQPLPSGADSAAAGSASTSPSPSGSPSPSASVPTPLPTAEARPPTPTADIQVASPVAQSASAGSAAAAYFGRTGAVPTTSAGAHASASPVLDPALSGGQGDEEEDFGEQLDGAGDNENDGGEGGPAAHPVGGLKEAKRRKIAGFQSEANKDTIPREIGRFLGNSPENLEDLEGWLRDHCRPYGLDAEDDARLTENARSRMTTLRKLAAQLSYKCGYHVMLYCANPRAQVNRKRAPRPVDMDWYASPELRELRFSSVGQGLGHLMEATKASRIAWAALSETERGSLVEENRLAQVAVEKAETERDAAEEKLQVEAERATQAEIGKNQAEAQLAAVQKQLAEMVARGYI